ncbi:MAG: ABC transporter permease [Bacteroidetes bacterium]|nr:ABC transporter permease [Bacteroidota bacterium]MBS1634007.1 ABC transporter permease [Bacteroidota bacterium]
MIKIYFLTAWRNILRHKSYAAINILGLAIALAACIVIFLVIQFEFSYNKYMANYKNIYQVVTKDNDAEGEHYTGGVPFPATKFLRKDFPQYQFAELMQNYGSQVSAKDSKGELNGKKFIENTGFFYAEPAILKMFDVKFLSGNANVLNDVSNVAISKTEAEKYFGNWKDAIGRRMTFDNSNFDYQVAAVFEDVPENTDFPFKIVASYAGFEAHNKDIVGISLDNWGANTSNHQVYMLADNGANTSANIASLNKQLLTFEKKYNTDNKETAREHFLLPLSNIHFDERFSNNGDHITSKTSLLTLAFIGILILLMACINFINLSTALAVTRSKEVGIRKVMGSSKTQLRSQIFAETTLVVCIAAAIAVLLAFIALPYVKNISVVQSAIGLFNSGSVLFILCIMAVTILLSGFYPAFILSRFKPVEAIKNKISSSKVGSISLRRVLVVLQFAFSQMLIMATIIAISQMNFIKKADLGFNKDAVLVLNGNTDSISLARHQTFKDALLARNDVQSVSFSFDAPSSDNSWNSNFAFDKMEDRDFSIRLKMGDDNYFKTYGMQLVAGRFYDASDTARSYVVNETLLKKVGIKNPQDAIGKMFRLGDGTPKPIIGVAKDFKVQSLREEVPPLVILPSKRWSGSVGIKLNSKNLLRSNQEIEALWNKYYPEYVYNATFLDDNINQFYLQDTRLSLLYKVYAVLAILISCLGLYGLISFIVVQKTKEVGVRKVLGASVSSIVYLFSKEFTILIGIAFLIAAPIAWYVMNNWLQDFKYRISIGIGVFAVAIVVSVVIAWLTVGYKSIKAAVANPVKSLRTE